MSKAAPTVIVADYHPLFGVALRLGVQRAAPDAQVEAVESFAGLREAITAMGITPAQVAGDIVEAMREDRFWIFTHEITKQALAVRLADIEAGRNPSNPYAGIEGLETVPSLD